MLNGIHLGQVATKEFLDCYQHQPPCHPYSSEQMFCCTKSRLQCFSRSSVVLGKLLGTFLTFFLLVDNHLIALIAMGVTMLDLRWLQKTACSGALAGMEEVQDTTYEGIIM